ncbi:hypothetical protein CN266_25485 [Bacillus cereus]|uniref:hypothetical protein n=1 Tax=Bacillus cereus TaxID=1396 RepID=UPI000BFA92E0|nr:hypothetical protein [Bacillus cereus]PFC60783.1 hypothetical protein CN266_25485 [Bacillus cereus]
MRDFRLNDGILSLVNCKFEYLNEIEGRELFLELIPLRDFLLSTPQILGVITKSNIELENEYNQLTKVELEIKEDIRLLKEKLVSICPGIDDTNYEANPTSIELGIDTNYLNTFKRFENLLNNIKIGIDKGTKIVSSGIYNNERDTNQALKILISKFEQVKQELNEQDANYFYLSLQNVINRYDYAYKKFVNHKNVSLSSSVHYINRIVKEINQQLPFYDSLEGLMKMFQLQSSHLHEFLHIRRYVYDDANQSIAGVTKEIVTEVTIKVRKHLKRVHYGILNGITQNLLHEQVISKYKTRCMWYDKERTRSLLFNEKGEYIRGKEDTLVKEMARYLFDNGYPVLFHIQTENLQTDLMDPSQKYPLLIEGKAYTSSVKSTLIRGIAQLHAYMNNFEATNYYIPVAYFIVFRLSGPIYDFPKEILTNRYRIIPVIIDLGDSSVSGSKQENAPVTISHKEIIHQIEGVNNIE